MLRPIAILGLLPLLLLATPASAAITAKEKMEICKFGADDQKLEGAKRSEFIKRCMAHGNFEPPGRKAAKKPAAKKPMANKPAGENPADAPAPAPKQ